METDEERLEAETRRLAPRLLRFCYSRSRSWQIAEDAAQEALIALVTRWRSAGPPDSPEAFCFSIANRRVGRQLGRRKREVSWEEHQDHARPGDTELPDQSLLRAEEQRRRLDQIQRLPARDREALLLVVAGELSLKAAAATLDVSVGALKMRLHRARQKLRNSGESPPRRGDRHTEPSKFTQTSTSTLDLVRRTKS